MALVFNVGLNCLLVDADSADEVADRPQRHFSMVDLADEWKLFHHHTPGIRLEDSDSVGDSHLRRNTDEQMDVIFVSVDFQYFDLWVLPRYRGHEYPHVASHTGLHKYFSSELGGEDQVVACVVHRVGLSAILHLRILVAYATKS